MADITELLDAGLEQIGLGGLSDDRRNLLRGYHSYLLEVNASLNLTGHRDPAESLAKNLLNSLAPWRHVDPAAATADIGTGGGLPGLPLAIALGMERLTLVESKQKKCRFLEQAVEKYARGVRVHCGDATDLRHPMDQIVCVGFGTLAKLLSVTRFCRAPGCRVLAWKGRRESVDAEILEAGRMGLSWEVHKFEVPGLDAERHLCIGS